MMSSSSATFRGAGTGEPPGALREKETIHQNGTVFGNAPGCFMVIDLARPTDVIGELCDYPPAKPSGKLPDTHSVGSFCDHNLGVFIVAKIAVENTDAVPPVHSVPRTPKAAYPGLQRCRAPRVPLTRLARLTAWQSLCT
jgi:hypothetical protein